MTRVEPEPTSPGVVGAYTTMSRVHSCLPGEEAEGQRGSLSELNLDLTPIPSFLLWVSVSI
jgi:hypothetical protein